jgi:SAM-dependent methyltransferase
VVAQEGDTTPANPITEEARAMDAQFWDDRYSSRTRLFSGDPNGVLVTEAADLQPGQALDVGCGEGGDALWLARRGWLVTAVDISQVALERAAAAGGDAEDRVSWKRGDLTANPPPADAFDLVTVHYFPFPRQSGHTALRGLLSAVAPGGTLLFVGHDITGLPPRLDDGHVPVDYYQPAEVAELLGADWTVSVNETRLRVVPAPPGTQHTHDTVVRARRAR